MLAWSIDAAMEANCFEEIYISTDSQKIFDIAIKFGATSGELRPLDYLMISLLQLKL